ncbi:MAG: hypothetical protein KatS3mg061_0243 [Dehalococcoidia bacterium]|nr:MAG: hypothetical protein KatS3mg061_0243 [Dehalococcoidia bacterium]
MRRAARFLGGGLLIGLLLSESSPLLSNAAGPPTPTPRPATTTPVARPQGQGSTLYLPIFSLSGAAAIAQPTTSPSRTATVLPSPSAAPPAATSTATPAAPPPPTATSTAPPAAPPPPTATSTATATPTSSTPDTQPPTAPTNLRAATLATDTVRLLWEPASDNVGVSSYLVYRGEQLITTVSSTQAIIGSLASDTVYTFTVRARDAAGNLSPASNPATTRTAAYDPTLVVPPIDSTAPTDFLTNVAFLYQGPNAVQTGVSATINPELAAVVRGIVRERNGAPLAGVRVRVLGRPELGETRTRANGRYDLVVNGGFPLTLDFEKAGYLPSQRTLASVPVQDYAIAPEVVLIGLDSQATTVTLDGRNPLQVARGSVVSDTRGVRQATVLFPQGVRATLVLSNGTPTPLQTLTVRATEYTVGPMGPQAMPGDLPPTSGYTYAVELSADEALAAGAREVRFSGPVYFYVENFIGFPVGVVVPAGYYDRQRGRVVAIGQRSGGEDRGGEWRGGAGGCGRGWDGGRRGRAGGAGVHAGRATAAGRDLRGGSGTVAGAGEALHPLGLQLALRPAPRYHST